MSLRAKIAALLLMLMPLTLASCSQSQPDDKETATTIDFGSAPSYIQDMKSCLFEEGWDVNVGGDGSISIRLPQDQSDAYDKAQSMCEKKFGYDKLEDSAPFTDAELRLLYSLELTTAKCLTEHGHDVGDTPSEQLYIDSYYDPALGAWYAYKNVWKPGTSLSEEEYYELLAACPRPADEGHPGISR